MDIDPGAVIRAIPSEIDIVTTPVFIVAVAAYLFGGWVVCLHIVRALMGYKGDGSFWP